MPTNTNTNAGKTPLKEIGVLWKRKAKTSGESYFSGVLKFTDPIKSGQEIQVILFSNKTKKAENHPDIKVYEKPDDNTTNSKSVADKIEAKAEIAAKKQPLQPEGDSEIF